MIAHSAEPVVGVSEAAKPRPTSGAKRPIAARVGSWIRYPILIAYAAIAVGPLFLIVMNSFKDEKAIFGSPLDLPRPSTFDLSGYRTVLEGAFLNTLRNSLVVTGGSVISVLVIATLAAFALARYEFRSRGLIAGFLAIGIFLPTTLGSAVVLQIFGELGLINNLLSLVLIYTAQSLPLAVFILTSFFRELPGDILDAARVDGANEFAVYRMSVRLVRPALGAVGVLTVIPVWNDVWWPIILAPSREAHTLILGTQAFIGQYDTDWSALLAILTLAMVPVLAVFAAFSRQLVRGITSGALK